MILTKKSRRFFYTVFQEVVILEIYLDVIFLENFLMDYILLSLTGKILQKHKKRPGMVAAAILGAAYTSVYTLAGVGQMSVVFQIMLPTVMYLMIRCAFEESRGKKGMMCVATCLALSFITGGILSWAEQTFRCVRQFRGKCMTATGAILFGYMFVSGWLEGVRERWFQKKNHLPVCIRFGNRQIQCRGLMDTGNSLYEPVTGRPVVIVERELLTQNHILLPEGFFAIPYHAIGTQKGILKGVLADELEIPEQQGEKRWQKVMLGIYEGKISQKDEYQVILHPKL